MHHPIAFHAEMIGDIMYYHQVIKQYGAQDFVNAIVKEVNDHVKAKCWKLIKHTEVPAGTNVIPSIWAMQCKQNLTMNEITKHKAGLIIQGGKEQFGMNYFDTYVPVVTWFAIHIMIVFGLLFGWAIHQIDFVQAYPQAPIKTDMHMKLHQGIENHHGNSKDYVLLLLSNLYRQK